MIIKKIKKLLIENEFIGNLSWILNGRVIHALSVLLSGIIIARCLGPEQKGVFDYTLAFITMFSAISGMGMEEIMVKEFNLHKNSDGEILVTGFILKQMGCIVAFLLTNLTASLMIHNEQKMNYIFIISIYFLFQSFDVIQYRFQSNCQYRYVALHQNIVRIVFLAIKIILAFYKCSLCYFVWCTLFEFSAISLILLYAYLNSTRVTGKLKYSFDVLKRIFKQSCPLIFASIAINIYMKIDQLMIGSLLGDYELGIYSVAVTISESWYIIPMALSAAMLPTLIKKYTENNQNIFLLFQQYADIMVLIAYGAIILFTVFSKYIIQILFGSAYSSASILVIIYIWSGIFVNMGLVRSAYVNIFECTYISLCGTVCGAIINVISNFVLIPIFGMLGAVAATILAQMVSGYLSSFFYSKTRQLAIVETKALFPFLRIYREIIRRYMS